VYGSALLANIKLEIAMRKRGLTTLVVLVGMLGLATAAFYAYDLSQSGRIAAGVTVGNVEIGGLSVPGAERRLRDRVLPLLRRPVIVEHGRATMAFAPTKARVRVDVRALVQDALDRSRRGGIVSRLKRELGGRRLEADIPLRVRYSSGAVRAFAAALARKVDRPPQRGRVAVAAGLLSVVPRRDGVAVRQRELEASIERALGDPRAPRRLTMPTDVLRAPLPRRELKTAIATLARQIDRPARDARVRPSPSTLAVAPSRDGVAVRRNALRRLATATLLRGASPRLLAAPTRILPARVTTGELAARYPYFITISRNEKRLRLFKKLKLVKSYVVAIGRIGYETPAGLYHVETKAVDPAWIVPNKPWAGALAGRVIPPGDPQNPLAARWMGFYDGAGIHGTDDTASLGQAASHGCVRMSVPDVIELYDIVPLHTPLYIG
jgi:lipoprotein-anchoring transpeptidase ErfK/SrfK